MRPSRPILAVTALVLLGAAACEAPSVSTSLEAADSRHARDVLNDDARSVLTAVYDAIDELPDDVEVINARQAYPACGDDASVYSLTIHLTPDVRLVDGFDGLQPWAEDRGWTARQWANQPGEWAFEEPDGGISLSVTARPERDSYSMVGVSSCQLTTYRGAGPEMSGVPQDITGFVRDRRPAGDLPVLDPDRGPVPLGGWQEYSD